MLTKNIEIMKAEIAAHIAADQVVQGTHWKNGKGSFIGCLTHSNDAKKVTERFGIPEPLVKICEHIFERSSEADSITFFRDVGDAIGSDGKRLSRIHWVFLRDTLKAIPKQGGDAQEVIDPVIEGMGLLAKGQHWPDAADAAYAAYSAGANRGAYAARVASHAAEAARIAEATRVASYSAGSADAVYAARVAGVARVASYASYAADAAYAGSATRSTEIKRQRESVLALFASA